MFLCRNLYLMEREKSHFFRFKRLIKSRGGSEYFFSIPYYYYYYFYLIELFNVCIKATKFYSAAIYWHIYRMILSSYYFIIGRPKFF